MKLSITLTEISRTIELRILKYFQPRNTLKFTSGFTESGHINTNGASCVARQIEGIQLMAYVVAATLGFMRGNGEGDLDELLAYELRVKA